jgi:antitoxin component YwqK of YwqJK toxin-antitoxin module
MKTILITLVLFGISLTLYAQDSTKNQRIQFIVDNVPVIDEPDEATGTLDKEDVAELTVITNKDTIEKMGYHSVDKIISVTTKEFKNRPEELKKIPTTKTMEKRDGLWYLKNADKPYSGAFIDYFYNGKKQGEGTLKDGKVDGLRTVYMVNGSKAFFRNYINGIANGYSEEYFPNGKLKQKGSFKDGLDDGLWVDYYSTGAIKRQMVFKDKKPQFGKDEEKFLDLNDKGKALMKDEDYKSAIKKFDDAIKLNAAYSDTYFYRGTAKLDDFDFDGAIVDFDKAIELEPLYMEAISNRAFARIRKYQFKNSRTLGSTNGVTILASKDNAYIPKDEKEKICADLNNGYALGDRKNMVIDAIKQFCQ